MFKTSKNFGQRFSPQVASANKTKNENIYAPIRYNKIEKNPKFDLKAQYRKTMELATFFSLAAMIALFHFSQDWTFETEKNETPNITIEVAEIPPTQQVKRQPPPPRPAVALPSEDEDIPDDLTIDPTELNLAELPPPPPPSESEDEDAGMFIAYDEPPTIVGGIQALLSVLEYPNVARKAGIEGIVVVGVEVDKNGKVLQTKILKGFETKIGFEKAAVKAVHQVKWKPAYQRDQPITVWVSVPVRFKLT